MGLVTPVDDDFPPESDSAVFSMLGYDVTKSYAGRGVVEAIGSDLDFRNGDLALRGNFATINDDLEIIDRRAGRKLTHKEAVDLSSSINSELHLTENATFTLLPTIGHRVTLIIKHPTISLTSNISNTDSFRENLLSQINFLHLNENENIIANQIIGTLDNDGYLRRGIDSIIDDIAFSENIEFNTRDIKNFLTKIQSLEPPGIAARNLEECLIPVSYTHLTLPTNREV
mgnify:CR=1 FL=1